MKANRLVVTLGPNDFADMLALLLDSLGGHLLAINGHLDRGVCELSNQVKVWLIT